jgi:hypothetical protein
MLGYNISIYKLQNGAEAPRSSNPPTTARLAVWQTGLGGMNWIYGLAKKGLAVHLGGGGYPFRYSARTEHVRPKVLEGPPLAKPVWGYNPGDILMDKWCGKTTIDRGALDACSPNEWNLVEAWDES